MRLHDRNSRRRGGERALGEPAQGERRVRGRRPCHVDEGAAMIEFCFLGVLLMVPLAYLVLTVFQVQNAAYAVSGASRDAGRAFATSSQADAASRRAHEAARVAMADHGLELGEEALRIDCEAPKCLTPGTAVATAIAVQVPLPFVPRFLGGSIPASIRVEARHIEYVDRFRDTG